MRFVLGLVLSFLALSLLMRLFPLTLWPDAGFVQLTFRDDDGKCYVYEKECTDGFTRIFPAQ